MANQKRDVIHFDLESIFKDTGVSDPRARVEFVRDFIAAIRREIPEAEVSIFDIWIIDAIYPLSAWQEVFYLGRPILLGLSLEYDYINTDLWQNAEYGNGRPIVYKWLPYVYMWWLLFQEYYQPETITEIHFSILIEGLPLILRRIFMHLDYCWSTMKTGCWANSYETNENKSFKQLYGPMWISLKVFPIDVH